MLKKNNKIKIITNGDDSIKHDVKRELELIINKDETFLQRFKYLLAVHNENLIAKDIRINRNT